MQSGQQRVGATDRLERRLDSAWTTWTQAAFREARGLSWRAHRPSRALAHSIVSVANLRLAIRSGAWKLASDLREQLERQRSSLTFEMSQELLACELEMLLAHGERDQAANFASRHEAELAPTATGVGLLELLGFPQPVWSSSGNPNFVGMSRRLRSGELDLAALADLFADRPWAWSRFPEALLLPAAVAWSAGGSSPLRFLNRFLRAEGLSSLAASAGAGPLFGRLHSAVALRASDGPLVSVLMPARNAARTLSYAIESLLQQTHQNLELLVADDGSDDDTARVLRGFGAHPAVRVYASAGRQGAYNLRNALAERARGELLTFHDADDYALPMRIEQQLRALRGRKALASTCGLLRHRVDGGVVFFRDHHALRLCRSSLMLRRDTFEALGGFRRARFGADEEIHARLAARFPEATIRVRAPLVLSLWSDTSATRLSGSEALEDGYRAPSRRAYSELVARRYLLGDSIHDSELDACLRETDNYLEPRDLHELR